MIPAADALLATYLDEHADITALDARVAGATPLTLTRPWVRVTQLDASDDRVSGIEHLIDYLVQFDCYAGQEATTNHVAQSEASNLARTVRVLLKRLQGTTLSGAVISSVRFTGHLRAPDTTLEEARERYILTASIHMHA